MRETTCATVASDEDMEVGFLLADRHAPGDPAARLRLFDERARADWGIAFDTSKLEMGAEPVGYVDDGDQGRPAREGETPDHHWYVVEGLNDAYLGNVAELADA